MEKIEQSASALKFIGVKTRQIFTSSRENSKHIYVKAKV